MGAIHGAAGGIQLLLRRAESVPGNPQAVLKHIAQALLDLVLGIERGVRPRGDFLRHAIHHLAHVLHAFAGAVQDLLERVGAIQQVTQAALAAQAAMPQPGRKEHQCADGEDGKVEVVHARVRDRSAHESAKSSTCRANACIAPLGECRRIISVPAASAAGMD